MPPGGAVLSSWINFPERAEAVARQWVATTAPTVWRRAGRLLLTINLVQNCAPSRVKDGDQAAPSFGKKVFMVFTGLH